MSSASTGAYEREAYKAPNAALIDRAPEAERDNLFSAHGRLGVLGFNARNALCIAAIWLCFIPLKSVVSSKENGSLSGGSTLIGLVLVLLMLPPLYVMIVSTIKRMHDLGYEGWKMMFSGIPLVGSLWTLYYSFCPSQSGSNEYGETASISNAEAVLGIIGIMFILGTTFVAFYNPELFVLLAS